ncbi:NlpC/P60 family protein [Shewanella sp. 1_MG-2023]|uniref:C40 family peptidase n=1 Tax=unclassified Shewanella TaxID=196818 RepID=UPI0026E48F7A|nr:MULTISPECIES: NlpC/P60 family protein [unclassified Shewanella]MDO6612734.1 NlpC/P60 family protein [Shewanella sp. 7_MG-2023]MDO6772695.1 NlpC/P60 family protein [Shewanella sp. 2_MG-2023]MDO6794859.1 NlpC/P60 family protein [Shewanella sp. 1_MG-2023]
MSRLILLLIMSVLLTACASNHITVPDNAAAASSLGDVDSRLWNEARLLQFHLQWQGTPYRLGGLTKKGLDCSGLVYVAYQDLVGPSIPRTVQGQTSLGTRVAKSDLQSGDLVFFKTTGSGRHVGVYLSGHRFLHVSTKKGVIISSMDNVYWKPRYWFASRL